MVIALIMITVGLDPPSVYENGQKGEEGGSWKENPAEQCLNLESI